MNKTYRLVWSDLSQTWVAVSETAASRSKRAAGVVLLAAAVGLGVPLPAAAQAVAPPPANALPTGGNVVAGTAAISQTGASMVITQASQRAAIDWQTFNVGSAASVNFIQPSSSAVVLNRVLSGNPSQIFGQINANGQVFLSNPGGVYFSPTASVNVGALVATTHSISNDDFMAGRDRFSRSGATGSVVNEGNLTADLGGYIALLAPEVRNHGVVIAQAGTLALAAGEAFELQFSNGSLANVQVDPATIAALVENGNAVQAPGGLIILSARAADQLQGSVVKNSGALEASSLVARGGKIMLTGDHINLTETSRMAATGATGGGEVLVGGGWQGSGDLHQATTVTMAQGASIDVSATQTGNGGTAVLWSDVHNAASQTRAYGTIWAKGGEQGGDGGRIETSGHWLDVSGIQASASAANGNSGLWLLDPYNVTIGSSASGTGYASTFTPAADSTILASDIAAALGTGTSVTITTGTSGGSIGDITVSSAITKVSGDTDVTLTLQAANSIVVDQAISNSGGAGKLNVVLDADKNNGVRDGGGIILLNNDISTGGGHLSFGTGATLSLNGVTTKVGGDVYVAGTGARSITTAGGNVTVNGELIIANTSGLNITATNGHVAFGGQVNSGNTYAGVLYFGTWSEALAYAASGAGSGTGDTYLATITSRLENALASRAVSYQPSWLGARRVSGIGTDAQWRWVTGPEGVTDSGQGTAFFTQTGNGTGTTTSGLYSNWSTSEPNNYTGVSSTDYAQEYESVLQFTGNLGMWNDLTGGPSADATASTLNYYVKETNLAASPLTVNAGTGTVTFSGAVGNSKALASLNVTGNTIAINGGAVTTQGLQTYDGNVTLGAAVTTLTQTNANTDFTVQTNKSISNATNADASLTIKTTGGIIMNSNSSISSLTGKLNTVLWADSDANANGGAISLTSSTITTNGGHLWLGGGSGSANWNGLTVGDGSAKNSAAGGNGITLTSSLVSSGAGNIYMSGQSTDSTTADSDGIDISHNNQIAIQSTTGSITLIGTGGTRNTGTTDDNDGLRISGSILSTTGAISLTGYSSGGNISEAIGLKSASISSTSGNIFINSDIFWMDTGTASIASNGSLTIAPTTAGRKIGIAGGAGAGDLSLAASYFNTTGKGFVDGFSSITIGRSDGTGKITTGAFATNDNLTLLNTSGGLELAGLLNAAANTVTLNSTGTISDSGSGAIAADKLALLNASAVTLDSTSNNVSTLAASGTGALTFVDSNALGIGLVTATGINATGPVRIETLTGDLSITENIVTTDTSADAVILNAGKSSAAGAATGGNILVTSGKTVSVGTNGTAKLYTGSISGSTNLAAMSGLGSGSGRFRYNADETNFASGSWTNLSTGLNAIYREQPIASVTVGSQTITYGDTFTLTGATSGLVNGDAPSYAVTGRVNSTSGYIKASGTPYTVTATDLSALGYNYTKTDGALTVNTKTLTLTGFDAASKTYDGNNTATINSAGSLSGVVTNYVVSVSNTGATFADQHVGTDKTVTLNGVSLGGTDASNYNIASSATDTANISARGITLTADAQSKTYGNADPALTYSGSISLVGTDTYIGALTRASGENVASYAINRGTLAINDGNNGNNYAVTYVGHNLAITQRPITLTATPVTKTYGDVDPTLGVSIAAGSLGSATVSDALVDVTGTLTRQSGENAGSYDLELGAGSKTANYAITFDPNNNALTIDKKTVSLLASKTYDGTTDLTGDVTITTGVGSETLSYSAANANDSHVATANKYISALTLADGTNGGLASNYQLPTLNASTAAVTITAATLTPTLSNTGVNKLYDGSTNAPSGFTPAYSFSGLVIGDTSASLTHTGAAYNDKDVTDANKITVSGLAISGITGSQGSQITDYVLDAHSKEVAATIIPRTVSLSASKTYDGTTNLTGTQVSIGTGVGSETLTYTGASANTAHVATPGKFINAITLTNGANGGLASNYQLPTLDGTSAPVTIHQAALTVSVNAASKTYDGQAYSGGNGVSYSGWIGGDTNNVLDGTLAYSGTSQGAIYPGNYSISAFGLSSGNYAITFVDGVLTIGAQAPVPPEPIAQPLPLPASAPAVLTPVAAPLALLDVAPILGGNPQVTVSLVRSPALDVAGVIAVSVPREMVAQVAGFRFPVPAQLFVGTTANAIATVNLPNGEPLPSWLQFVPETRSFVAASVPQGAFPVRVVMTVEGRSSTIVISERDK